MEYKTFLDQILSIVNSDELHFETRLDKIKELIEDRKNIKETTSLHPDSIKLLEQCFEELKAKMIRNQKKYGYTNEWLTSDWEDECREHMMQHIKKGDPKDVAIYAMFMMYRGWSTSNDSSFFDKNRRHYQGEFDDLY